MQKFILFLLAVFIFTRCRENELGPAIQSAATTIGDYYVSTGGSDSNNGSSGFPWRTLKYAAASVLSGSTIHVAGGIYVEYGQVAVPTGVSIIGAGIGQTILRIASAFYYHPASPSYAADKFLMNLTSGSMTGGNQTISNFSIDGDSKQLHGGIFVRNRSNVTVSNVKVQNTNFTGIWLWSLQDSRLLDSQILNCSWGSSGYVVGALNIGDLTRVEIARVNIDENKGYGIKAIGPPGNNNIINTKVHDCRISVVPFNLWNGGGSVSNFAIELWACNLVTNEFYNNYIDNIFSIVNENNIPSTGVQTVRVHHNTFDLGARAQGATYAVELYFNDVEFDHNFFIKGTQGIANWAGACKNWSIHHNTFYALQGTDPGECLRVQSSGLHNVVFYNNTIEFASDKTMNVIGIYGGSSDNVDVKNNLFINNSGAVNHYPNEMIHMENAQISGLQVRNNSFWKMAVGTVPGTYYGNKTSDPKVSYSGARPDSYYMPTSTSPLINAGLPTGIPYIGSAPDIGALEFAGSSGGAGPLFIDSQSATLAGRMAAGYHPDAKNQNFFSVPASYGNSTSTPPGSAATFTFNVSAAGNYIIWARVQAPNGGQMLNIYNGSGKWFPWRSGAVGSWMWTKITDGGTTAQFPFVNGSNSIKMGWMDGGVQVDEIMITQDASYVPHGPN